MLSREYEISKSCIVNVAGHSCSSLRASNPREHFDFRSRFLCFRTANQKIQINSKILCPQSPSILVPRPRRLRDEKRAMGTRMGETKVVLNDFDATAIYAIFITLSPHLRTFALIVSAHPYWARKSTCHAMPRHASNARAKC